MEESEATIQEWFEDQCYGKGILPHIRNRSAVQSALRQSALQDAPFSLGQTAREALLRAAETVMEFLAGADLVASNENISPYDDDVLKPDLLLMDPEKGDIIIVELKKSHQTSRQAITELMAYAQAIEAVYPGAQIGMVLVSPDWRALLDYAVVHQVTTARRKLLALEIATCPDSGFSLRVRIDDLLRSLEHLVFHSDALPAETVTFERRDAPWKHDCPVEVTSALATIAREGDRSGGTGFALLCRSRRDHGYQWHITVLAIDPFRMPRELGAGVGLRDHPIESYRRGEPLQRTKVKPAPEGSRATLQDRADAHLRRDSEPPDPGAAMALIYTVYSRLPDSLRREHDNMGNWDYFQSDLFHDRSMYLNFEAWGLLGDLIRHNATRSECLDRISLGSLQRPAHWNEPVNWIRCIDVVTGEYPLHDDLLTVSSCHALGTTFHAWSNRMHVHGSSLGRTLANARVICAIQKVTAIAKRIPTLADTVPRVDIQNGAPRYHHVANFLDWMHAHFLPAEHLQFAFSLGCRLGQPPRYRPLGAPRVVAPAPAAILEKANQLLADALRTKTHPGLEHYRTGLEARLEGRSMTPDDLADPFVRTSFVEAVSSLFEPFAHPVAPQVAPVVV